jgi:hypothetical protein
LVLVLDVVVVVVVVVVVEGGLLTRLRITAKCAPAKGQIKRSNDLTFCERSNQKVK